MESDVLTRFYKRVQTSNKTSDLALPYAIVYYVRRGIEATYGQLYDLEHVECALYLEGYLNPDKHFPEALPQWYVDKYLNGDMPNMEALRTRLRRVYHQRLERQRLLPEGIVCSEADIASVPPK